MNRIKEELPKLRIAFVKQDVYQDLYVVPTSEHDPAAILFSSMGRVGPIGLMADLGADFYIVKEEPEPETPEKDRGEYIEKTGDWMREHALLLVAGCAGMSIIGALIYRYRIGARGDDWGIHHPL